MDTNILISWLFETGSSNYIVTNDIIRCLLKKGEKPKVLEIAKIELGKIILDAFSMMIRILNDNLTTNWDSLSILERKKMLNEIVRNYDDKYNETYKKVETIVKNLIPRGGVRLLLSKKFFQAIIDQLINKTYKQIQDYLNSNDLINFYIDTVNIKIESFFEVINPPLKTLSLMPEEIIIMSEGIHRAKRNVEKIPSFVDQIEYISLYLLLRERVYDKILFITNDNDFKRIYDNMYNFAKDVINGERDPRRYLISGAEKVINILNNLEITPLNRISCSEI